MRHLSVNEIREEFLAFFERKEHLRLPSFPLVPQNDPSILLINAGMTPMKTWFTGAETPPHPRVTTCQKCIRTPDIDLVGQTARHGTFFEMLGNFSFGDYFKAEIIPWAWELCTEVFQMPKERLYATVYHEDDEAYDIWHKHVGLPEDHLFRFGKEDNFWEHGVGPCGPCSEIFFDRGPQYSCGSPDCTVGCECDRYIEFWNLVFTQFDRLEDGSYVPLTHKNIDTGAGLERFAVILQEVDNFFDVDNIRAIIGACEALAGCRYGSDEKTDVALRVITDHIRSTVMMISDGILPSNEGRGYILRRLLRRAARFGRLLEIPAPFLHGLADLVIQQVQEAYPETLAKQEQIRTVILREEESFERTISQGLIHLNEGMKAAEASGEDCLAGDFVFKLHDTFGFPMDLTREIASEAGLRIDREGFDKAMAKQRSMGRQAQLEKTGSAWDKNALPEGVSREPSQFLGYHQLEAEARVTHLFGRAPDGSLVEHAQVEAGQDCLLLLDQTVFYGESGGQVGDQGRLFSEQFTARVKDCDRSGDGVILHHVHVEEGSLAQGDLCQLQVDATLRLATARNHSATHLLHKALAEVLGAHVEQAGSLVHPKGLRFDFKHFQAMSDEELRAVENMVNDAILAKLPIESAEMSLDEAMNAGAKALFSEKYGDVVRVISMGDFSLELCGGTHLSNTAEICVFRLQSESGIAAGVRRIEALTGLAAIQKNQQEAQQLAAGQALLKCSAEELAPRIQQLLDERKQLTRELQAFHHEANRGKADALLDELEDFGPFKLLMAQMDGADPNALREAGDRIKSRHPNALIILASGLEGKVLWLAMAAQEAVKAGAHCGNLIREAAKITGGGGGGRPDMAQAGGKAPEKIEAALKALREQIQALFQGQS